MKRITGGLTIVLFLLCAFSAQAAPEIDISVPSAGEPCSSDLDCAGNEICITDICIPSAGEPCSSDLDCTLGGPCVNDVCVPSVGDPCSDDTDCGDGMCENDICVPSAGEPCSSDLDCELDELCIEGRCTESECETSADCGEGAFCIDNTCVWSGDCELIIKPSRININRKKNPPYVRQKLRVKGNENFDPLGEISVDDPLLLWGNTIRPKRKQVRFIIDVTTDPMPEEGFYPIRVGSCIGEIELYDKKAAKAK